MRKRSSNPETRDGWLLLSGLVLALGGLVFGSGWARAATLQEDENDDEPPSQVLPTLSAGGTADSNGSMIAVTGVDITGQSILYLIDTETKQICAYQASGGSSSTQGIKFVGARRIDLDLELDGLEGIFGSPLLNSLCVSPLSVPALAAAGAVEDAD